MYTNVKIWSGKELWLKVLVNSGYTHTSIDEQLVREDQDSTTTQTI